MDVAIAGGHGQVALRLARLLSARGDEVRSLIRDPTQAADVEAAGARAVLCDLEVEEARGIAKHVAGTDAVVFAAGAGPGSGPERKRTVDLGAALKLIGAAERTGVRRYVMVSSVGAHDPEGRSEAMRPYLRAKAEADAALAASGLDYTIVRPGSLTDDPGTGRVALSTELGNRGPIPRDDVAAVLAACLDVPETIGLTFEAFAGEQEVELAVRALARAAA
ncbi:MAG TPA: SDR family oxidoreductase [Solirubrobacteraceae bacterium]|nr:SDR family oxidoreductase [Solirubrobacteraceae bacterium]